MLDLKHVDWNKKKRKNKFLTHIFKEISVELNESYSVEMINGDLQLSKLTDVNYQRDIWSNSFSVIHAKPISHKLH